MEALQTNNLWRRRIPQVALTVAFIVIVFYTLTSLLAISSIDPALYIATVPAGLAGFTALLAGISYIRLPKKMQWALLYVTQVSLLITVGYVIHTTGGVYSYFLPLWILVVTFAGVFGTLGLVTATIIPIGYAVWLFVTYGSILPMAITIAFVGGVSLFLSHILSSHLGADRDNSSYKQLANQLSQVSGKSEVVINAITNGVIALDKQGVVELINPEAQRLIGWESRDALKLDYKSVLKLIDKDSKELTPANDPVRRALSTNEEVQTEALSLITNSGKKVLISLVASPVGQIGSGAIVVFRDITKEKAEEREQAEFISTASHEMRTPVASIEGYLGLALNPNIAQVDEKARSYITKAHEVAQHLGRLFQDLLDVTKAEDGRLSNNPRAVEVVTFVQDIVGGLRPQAEAKGLVLLYKPVPDGEQDEKSDRRLNPVYYANVDNDHLREVVANLVENAIKYTKQGSISVDVGGDDRQVVISVQDTGIGIPTEDLSHLFQKFYRVDNSDTREIGGTGLGLYLSRRLAETMEGRITAESQQGQGSTFSLAIPRISHQEAMQLIETLHDEEVPQPIGPSVSSQPLQSSSLTPPFTPQTVTPAPSGPIAPIAANGNTPSEGVFVNPPADAIAAQLSSPSTPTPQLQQSPSLATIEQNPGQYLRYSSAPQRQQVAPPAVSNTPESPAVPPQTQNNT